MNQSKEKIITLLCVHDDDFAFEYACRGLQEIMRAYNHKELKERLKRVAGKALYLDTRNRKFWVHNGTIWEKVQ